MNNIKLFDNRFDIAYIVEYVRSEGFPIERNA